MIPQTNAPRQADKSTANTDTRIEHQPVSWQRALADIIRDPQALFSLLHLDPAQIPSTLSACEKFPLKVPRAFANRMTKGDWNDPLLQQVLPKGQELDLHPGYSSDPLDETNSNPAPGLIHKYQGRVLLVVSGGCAINCRYCFRRDFPYESNNPNRAQWQQTLDYLRGDSSIHEVIFSGGDPLAASDTLLAELVESIAQIPHITTLRVHSRMPVVIPQRITPQCLRWLTGSRLKAVMVIHCNHANEIDEEVGASLQRLKSSGVTVLNQAVLLAGVNNNEDALAQLSERLFQFGVLPYYLHLLDKVTGAAHFDVPETQGQRLIQGLQARLPGYLIPRLVKELPGAPSKILSPIPIESGAKVD